MDNKPGICMSAVDVAGRVRAFIPEPLGGREDTCQPAGGLYIRILAVVATTE